MAIFIDKRKNPTGKNVGNRQRFMRRARASIKEAVDQIVRKRSVSDVGDGETISIPTKGIDEPTFQHARRGGTRRKVLPGNKKYIPGDQIPKPPSGDGGGGKQASDSGEGEDEFQFALTREEFLNFFFEDLKLPDLVKKAIKDTSTQKLHHAGITTVGTPSNLNILRTMRQSLGRRLALGRPRQEEIVKLEKRIAELEVKKDRDAEEDRELKDLRFALEELMKRRRIVPFIDPDFDLRFNFHELRPEPNAQAVVFCLMDVSGSMGEREKDLAKRFFYLLCVFLDRYYKRTEVVFIRHTHEAQEVDEETFFYSRESGGTIVSTALEEMQKIIKDRYPPSEWNIYAAQASDGDNFSGDSEKCAGLLDNVIMPLCQYYAYIEIIDEREKELYMNMGGSDTLWKIYQIVNERWPNFEMKRVGNPEDIYPVFRELFTDNAETSKGGS